MGTALRRVILRALVISGVALAAGAQAQAGTGLSATLKAPLAAPRQAIIDGVMWKCSADSCQAADIGQQPRTACGQVAHRFGEVAGFVAGGRRFSDVELARCNAGR